MQSMPGRGDWGGLEQDTGRLAAFQAVASARKASGRLQVPALRGAHEIPRFCDGRSLLENARYIGPCEIATHVKQTAAPGFGHFIGETIAKSESCRVNAFSPLLVSLRDASR